MSRQYTTTNGIINNAEMEVFIIPNRASKIQDWFLDSDRERLTEVCTNVANGNGFGFDPENDKLVQLWFSGMGSQNICDHGVDAVITDEYGDKYVIDSRGIGYLPAFVFAGHKEGETITLAVPVIKFVKTGDKKKKIKTVLGVQVKLSQSVYRYRRFGNFEEVLAAVTC